MYYHKDLSLLTELIERFESLPSIGHRSAERLAYHLLSVPKEEAQAFADSIVKASREIHRCPRCFNLTQQEICCVCADKSRDPKIICVVEAPKDVAAMERVRQYNGLYHVLGGCISPVKGVSPDQLHIPELARRVAEEDVEEVILALNNSVEGEVTTSFINKLLLPYAARVTRLASGLPVGALLERSDEMTILRALERREEL